MHAGSMVSDGPSSDATAAMAARLDGAVSRTQAATRRALYSSVTRVATATSWRLASATGAGITTSAPSMFQTNLKVSKSLMSAWNLIGDQAQVVTPAVKRLMDSNASSADAGAARRFGADVAHT